MLTSKQILMYLAIKYNGDWDTIWDFVKDKKDIVESEVHELVDTCKYGCTTLLDEDCPKTLREKVSKPPFALFYQGNINLLNERRNTIQVIESTLGMLPRIESAEILDNLSDKTIILTTDELEAICMLARHYKVILIVESFEGANDKLANDIVKQGGLVITESLAEPKNHTKMFWKRYASSLAQLVFIGLVSRESEKVEHDVELALAYNGNVCTIPASIRSKDTYINNGLIKDGAPVITTVDELYEQLNGGQQ